MYRSSRPSDTPNPPADLRLLQRHSLWFVLGPCQGRQGVGAGVLQAVGQGVKAALRPGSDATATGPVASPIPHAGRSSRRLLQESDSDRRLPIWIGLEHAIELAFAVVTGPHGAAEVDARPSDALALAMITGAPVRADRAMVEITKSDETVAEALTAIDRQEAGGPQALLDELAEEAQRHDPPKPANS